MLFKTFIRKQLRLKAHTVTEIEPSDEQMVVQIERLGARKLCCSRCRRPYRRGCTAERSGSVRGAIYRYGRRRWCCVTDRTGCAVAAAGCGSKRCPGPSPGRG